MPAMEGRGGPGEDGTEGQLQYYCGAVSPLLVLSAVFFAASLHRLSHIFDDTLRCPWTGRPLSWLSRVLYGSVRAFARHWHDYEVHGLENVRPKNCVLVSYHSRCSVDAMYAVASSLPTTVVSHLVFLAPFAEQSLRELGFVPSKGAQSKATDEAFAEEVVHGNKPVLVLPGGAYECFHMSSMRHKVDWKPIPGFARALLAGDRPGQDTAVVPFYTNNCDSIYYNIDWWHDYSGHVLRKNLVLLNKGELSVWSVPMFTTIGVLALGLVIFPRPVKLDTYFGKPIVPKSGENDESFAYRVKKATQDLIDEVRAKHSGIEHVDFLKLLRWPIYTCFVIFQNVVGVLSILFAYVVLLPIVLVCSELFGWIFRVAM